jgi:uncharacterized protein YggE
MLDSMKVARAAALLALLGGAVRAQSPSQSLQPQIITVGQGEVRVVPDRATVTVGVQSRAGTAAEASAINARKQKAVTEAIRAKGVAQDQIATSGFGVQPEMKYDKPGSPPTVVGYLVTNLVTVQLQQTDKAGPVIDASIAAGADEIQSLAFSISNPDSARRAAIAIAVSRAKGDAEAAAKAAGGALGTMLELTVGEFEIPAPRPMAFAARMKESPATPIEAGMEPVRASVTVRWQFVPPPR